MGFTRAELESFRGATVPDLVGPGLRLLFVGINPGLWTAATSTHFAHPGNRFYPALLRAGVIDRPIDRGVGMTDDDRRYLVERGIGITNLVARATPGPRRSRPRSWSPVAGACASSSSSTARASSPWPGSRRTAPPSTSRAPCSAASRNAVADAELWAVPNPSGLNAHETIDSLAEWYRQAAAAAGVV